MSSCCITKTIVEKNGKGFAEWRISEGPLPNETDLKDDQVLVAFEAAPINPSDIGPIFAPSWGGIGKFEGAITEQDSAGRRVTALPIQDKTFQGLKKAGQVGKANRLGNEGAGRVVAAGRGAEAQALKGKVVAAMQVRGSYGQHAILKAKDCLPHLDGTTCEEAASSFVNPLTSLGMVKTMRAEGHKAIVHTAAASQLGQMLVKICKTDGIPLVNIVRRPEQVALLKELGAEYVVDTSVKGWEKHLLEAVAETGATIAFDATGGGTLGFEIIKAMETAAQRKGGAANNYGSDVFKKLYIYGGLNAGEPLQFRPHAGMGGFSWAVQGFLMGSGHAKIEDEDKKRVAKEIKTTFATVYSMHLSLDEMLDVEIMKKYQAQSSNSKALVTPFQTKSKL